MGDEQGFATIPRSMLYDPDTPRDAKLVYLMLSSHVGGNRMAWPSHARMANLLGMSKTQVKAMLRWLEREGHVQIVRRTDDDGVALTNEYKLVAGSQPSKEVGQDAPRRVTPRPTGSHHAPPVGQDTPEGGASGDYERESLNDKNLSSSAKPPRPEVIALCEQLADRIERNTGRRPKIGQRWLDACRLLIDVDKHPAEKVAKAIDWCQSDEFWRCNILSMPKLREKYDTMALQAQRQQRAPRDFEAERAEQHRARRRADAIPGWSA